MSIRLCIFDVAGTTVEDDDVVLDALAQTVIDRGVLPRRTDILDVMGLPKPVALRRLFERYGANNSDEAVASAHAEFEERLVRHYQLGDRVFEIEGTSSVFRELRSRGIKVVLDTGFSRRILDAILQRLGWREGVEIDAAIASDEVAHGRPAPDMIHRAMQLFEIPSASVCKVGDTVADIAEGRAASARLIVGVTSGACGEAELLGAGATIVLPTVAGVPRLLRSGEQVHVSAEARSLL